MGLEGTRDGQSVGYRIGHGTRSVTISGDTKFDENLISHAMGTKLLIHEVFAMSEQLKIAATQAGRGLSHVT